MDLECVLAKLGVCGPYHLKLMLLLAFVCITNSWYSTNYVFVAEDVNLRCKYTEYEESSILESIINMTEEESKCYKYKLINDEVTRLNDSVGESNVVDCDEWVYEDPNSFVAEFDIGCENWKRTLVGTMHSSGYMIGLLIVGPISDKFGRKNIIVFCGVTGAIMGLARSITSSYWLYVALEFVEALIGDPFSPTFTLCIEMVTKEKRVLVMCIIAAIGSISGAFMALIAWAVPYWRHFLRILYAPSLFFILYLLIMDESLRWLLSKGKKDEAIEIIRKAAKTNNVDMDADSLSNIKCEEDDTNTDLLTLLKITITSKTLVFRVLACISIWIATTFNTYALLINSVSLEGNKYLHYGITTLCGLPSSLVLAFLLYKCKRKNTLFLSLGLTGIIFVVQSLIPKYYPLTAALLFYAGKFNSAIAFAAVYLYTSELFPTYTRNTMHALCSSMGRIGAILAPQTPLLVKYWTGIPSVLVGGLSLTTALVIVLMPDTSEVALPDTVRQAEALGSKEPQKTNGAIFCSRL